MTTQFESSLVSTEELVVKPPHDPVEPYKEALREYFPSKETILVEAKAYSRRSDKIKTLAGAALISAIATIVWQVNPILESQEMATSIGEHRAWQMADGTSITLNTNSIVTTEYRLHSRQSELVQGEAMFRVAHEWRTFSVKANRAVIRDIGTAFNVRNTVSGMEVSVVEGKVEVAAKRAIQVLTKNQRIAMTQDEMGPVESFDVSTLTAWQNGKLMFDGTPLKEIVPELQRYRKASIKVLDEKAGKLRISGEYDIQAVEELIDLLPSTIPVKVKRGENNEVVISSR